MTQTNYDADDVLMGGGNAPAWKFNDPGTTHVGTILTKATRQERDYDPQNPGGGALKFFPSGDPIMGIVIEVQTEERAHGEDDGKRTFYVEGQHLKNAVRDAVKAAGASKLELGARLQVTFTHREDPMDKRSRKYWQVIYTGAADAALAQPAPAQQQYVPTEQGQVNWATGEIQQQAAPVAQAPAAQPAGGGLPQPTPEQLAAVRANGVDPKAIFPHWNGVG